MITPSLEEDGNQTTRSLFRGYEEHLPSLRRAFSSTTIWKDSIYLFLTKHFNLREYLKDSVLEMGCCYSLFQRERQRIKTPVYFQDKLLAWDDLEPPREVVGVKRGKYMISDLARRRGFQTPKPLIPPPGGW